ncbi:MAG: SDR family NAD(P)-dependent oxidoreductase [Acidimicrobiales bacterium]|jgi:decaprenylphospho-beta-D-erythro-pentofuranosid-2-ulose 2-reductase
MIDATGMPQTAVVIGGASQIARDTLALLADRRLHSVVLGGRDEAALKETAIALGDRGVTSVATRYLDVTELERLDEFAAFATAQLDGIDLLLVAAGDLGTSELDALDGGSVARAALVNFAGPAAAIGAFVSTFRAQGTGRIVILSSVAGVRVRKANFVYGAAKAGIDAFGLGLADALEGSGVEVTVVRPGFVRTKMTSGMRPAPFAVESSVVAEAIVAGMETGASVIWVPLVLREVFALMQVLPRALWRKLPG